MNRSMITSAVSMQALQQKLDLIASNMANVDTVGYKKKSASFQDVLTTVKQQSKEFQQEGRLTPPGYTQGWGSRMSAVQQDMSQGSLKNTEDPLHLAIEGNGLFEVGLVQLDENGQAIINEELNVAMETLWTRDGSFHLQPVANENFSYLTTADGYFVKDADSLVQERIRIPNGQRVVIDANGRVQAYDDNNPDAPAVAAGRVKVVNVMRPGLLQNVGDNMYTLAAGIENPREALTQLVVNNNRLMVEDPETLEFTEAQISMHQGFVEQSNVDLTTEMSELMTVQRAYQMNSRALVSGDNLMNLANNLRG
jgi:flagellar basal-body rod protein FlgG